MLHTELKNLVIKAKNWNFKGRMIQNVCNTLCYRVLLEESNSVLHNIPDQKQTVDYPTTMSETLWWPEGKLDSCFVELYSTKAFLGQIKCKCNHESIPNNCPVHVFREHWGGRDRYLAKHLLVAAKKMQNDKKKLILKENWNGSISLRKKKQDAERVT